MTPEPLESYKCRRREQMGGFGPGTKHTTGDTRSELERRVDRYFRLIGTEAAIKALRGEE